MPAHTTARVSGEPWDRNERQFLKGIPGGHSAVDRGLRDALSEISALLDRGRAEAALNMIERCKQAITTPPPGSPRDASGQATVALPGTLPEMPTSTEMMAERAELAEPAAGPETELHAEAALGLLLLEVARGRALSLKSDYEHAEEVLRGVRERLVQLIGNRADDAAARDGIRDSDSNGNGAGNGNRDRDGERERESDRNRDADADADADAPDVDGDTEGDGDSDGDGNGDGHGHGDDSSSGSGGGGRGGRDSAGESSSGSRNSSGRALLLLGLAECDTALGEMHHRRTEFRQALHHFRSALANYRAARKVRPASPISTPTPNPNPNPSALPDTFPGGLHGSLACASSDCGPSDACEIDREIARVKVMMAESLMSCGEFAEAGALSDEALVTFSECGDLAWRGRAAKAKGTVFWYQDRFNEALTWYERAEDDLVQSGMLVQAAFVNNNRALVYWKINQPAEAVRLFEYARPVIASAGMETEAATIDVNTSIALASLGRTEEALALLDRAGEVFERLSVRQKAGWVDYYRGKILAEAGRHREAIDRFARAKACFDDQAIDTYRAQTSLYLGLSQLELGKLAEARAACQEALDVATARDVPDLAFPALYGLARATEPDDPPRALDLYTRSIREIERMRQSLAEDRLKRSFVFDKTRVYDAAISLAVRLGRYDDALAIVERAKSRAFVDSLKVAARSAGTANGSRGGTAPAPRSSHSAKDAGAATATLSRSSRSSRSCPSSSALSPSHGAPGAPAGPNGGLPDSNGVTEIHGMGNHEAGEAAADPLLFAASILSHENVADAIIEFYLLPQELLVFVATAQGAGGAAPLELERGARSLEVQLLATGIDRSTPDDLVAWLYTDIEIMQSAPGSFVASNMPQLLASYDDHARALYDALIAPVERHIAGRRRLLIVPHGPLHQVPFHALHDGRRYVIDSHEVFFAPSLGALEAIWRKGHRAVRTCLAVGVKDDAAPLAEAECGRVAALFGTGNARLLLGEDATVDALSQSAPGFDVVHVAGHAVFNPEDPMRSHIKLAGGGLSALDVFETRMECALVMLSACQTGVAYVSSGDELLGLSRGVFRAGASSLVASLWKVNDESTVDLAVEFYRSLLAGRTKPEALRCAVLRIRDRLPHPYYWAPFVLLGDPRPDPAHRD
ncbi:MAG: CHAT domain-containing protein [Bacillota bacterium]|nr:CHAT domain-containing protein [Bacillota bacterium]